MNTYISYFSETAKSHGERTALVDRDGTRRTSYAQLLDMSGRVAAKLLSKNHAPGTPIIINMDRRREYVAAYLGIQMAGCAAVTVIPEYPQERVDYIREDCQAKDTVTLDFFADLAEWQPVTAKEVPADTPAYLIYTSGSTGRPKGVLHTVASLNRMTTCVHELWEIDGPLVHAQACTFSFALFMFDMLCPLKFGAEVHVISENTRKDAKKLEKYYVDNGITIGFIAPQLLKNFHVGSSALKRILTAGELLSNVFFDNCQIVNIYGTSEAGLLSCFHVDKAYRATPIGHPFEDCEFVIASNGELCVKAIVAKEYVNLPEKSAETFEKQADGTILYHTGDVVELNENGDYVYKNRLDWMVKINGQRVETLEIENVIKEIPAISNAAVKAFTDEDGQNYLCAYFVGSDEATVRGELKKKLPDYMLPRFFVAMDKLPTNVNGKLDRLSLQPPSAENYKTEYVAPTNARETAVCQCFSDILRCGKVGLDDDFFALGGDSIKVMKLVNGIEDALHLTLSTKDVFKGKTVRSVVAALKEIDGDVTHQDADTVPLSESQRGVYLECAEHPESTMYNIPFAMVLPEDYDDQRFANAVNAVARRHPALFATFAFENGEPVMKRGEVTDVVKFTSSTREDFVKPFDLEKGPLYRFELNGRLFLFDVHHLVFDGTSVNVLLSQITDAYEGRDIPDEKMTPFDFAVKERDLMETEDYRQAREYFKTQLEGLENDEPLIADVAPVAGEEMRSRIVRMKAPKSLRADVVENFARQTGLTENHLFLSAFAYALAAFSGTDESCFTTASNGRREAALAHTVGMFVKMLPLHIVLPANDSVSDFLQSVRHTFLQTLENDCISFGELARDYGVTTDFSFVYQSNLLDGIEELPVSDCQSKLLCMVMKTAEGYEISMHYRQNLFSEKLMESLCDTIFGVAEQLMSCEKLSDVKLLNGNGRAFVDAFNRTETAYVEKTVNARFEQVVKAHPENLAVVDKDAKYTFGQFDELTRNLAGALHAKGLGAEDFVAVLVPRNAFMAIAAWGVIRSGAAFQPLDPTYPQERLEYMVNDSGAKLLIADKNLRNLLPNYNGDVIFTDEIADLKAADFIADARPENALTMIYTSGTTGKPKGCVLENRNLAAFYDNHAKIMEMDENTRVASYASFGFDAGVMDVVATPLSGGTLYVIPDEIRLDMPKIEEFYIANGITHGFMTTQLGRMFAQSTKCKTLKAFTVGGEKLVPFTPQESFRFINGYGPCETMAYICHHVVTDNSPVQSIGTPSDNIKLYVVDKYRRLVPVGAVGELCISGCQVGRGYLGLPEKTAEVFVENPFEKGHKGYGRMYRTGDVVRLLPQGELEYVGRRDGQVKIRGFRVELTEIEEVIRRFDGIDDATVAAFDDPAGGKFVAAYVVSQDTVDIAALNAFIASEKPAYMVPATTMQIDAIPYTQNQKVNKRALPKPARQQTNVEIVKPKDDVQQRIWDIAKDILGHEDFGIENDLFEVGMTSIGLLKFNVALGQAFDVALKISDLKSHATIAQISTFLGGAKNADTYEKQTDYPLMQNQMGVFVESTRNPDTTEYNVPLLMSVDATIDTEKLQKAVCAAIDAHPYLKMQLNDDVRAVRHDELEPKVDIVKIDKLTGTDGLIQPFELVGKPLYRAKILEAGQEKYLFFDIHHIVTDGMSMTVLLNDIDTALKGETVENERSIRPMKPPWTKNGRGSPKMRLKTKNITTGS